MHAPVLLNEVLELARAHQPANILDGTFGRGGHMRALLEAVPESKVTALDQDEAAVTFAKTAFAEELQTGRLTIHRFNFHDVERLPDAPVNGFDFVLLDLGVSSPQLDEPERGFSFYHDGPLDMRMDQRLETTAADILNTWPEVELIDLFRDLGEVRRPQRVVRAIVNDRKLKPYASTRELGGLIERVEGWRKKGHHPATSYFLALRMAVNRELSGLQACLPHLRARLSERGRLVVITFHSLEDRIIKYDFKGAPEGAPLFKRVVVPTDGEIALNPRARSAKLRVFQKGLVHESAKVNRYRPVP